MIRTQKYGTLEYLTADGIPVPHGFTTRLGGVSTGTQSSLNLAVGRGDSLEKAVDALRAEAPGILFLDTADYVLLTGEAEDCMERLQDYVRPGTRVYKLEGTAELSEIGPFLKTHGPDAPLYRLQKRELQIPKLTAEGEKLHFEGQ